MRAPASSSPTFRQIAVIAWLGLLGAACAPHSPSSQSPTSSAVLELKDYASKAAGQNRAIALAVTGFREANAIGSHYPGGGHRWLVVDAQWTRVPSWNPPPGTATVLHLRDQFFLLVDGERRIDPSPPGTDTAKPLPIDDVEIPAPNAPATAGQYVFEVPDQAIHSLELVSFDASLGLLRVALFGTPEPGPAPLAPPAHNASVEVAVLGTREAQFLGPADAGLPSRFLLVDLRLRNVSATDVTSLDPNDGWYLSDAVGDRYPATSMENLDGRLPTPLALPPAMAERGAVVFTVPVHHFALTLHVVTADRSVLTLPLPDTGAAPGAAGAPLAQLRDGNVMAVSVLSAGRTGTLAPGLEPDNSVMEAAGSGSSTRYVVIETEFQSLSDADTQVQWNQLTLVHGSTEDSASSLALNALPSELDHSEQGLVPAHGTRRYYFVFVHAPDAGDDLVVRYHGASGTRDLRLPATHAAAPPTSAEKVPVNVADWDTGGEIESLSGTYGSGFTGRDLLRGNAKEAWTPENGAQFPFDIVLSFYRHAPATVSGVEFVLPPDTRSAPHEVEVWSSTTSASAGFSKLVAGTLDSHQKIQRLSFDPIESRFIKVHILSGNGGPFALELAGIRVLEASQPGYSALMQRFPDSANWALSARRAAQVGIDWLETATIRWQSSHRCFGCHVQAQTVMGLAVARRNEYIVSDALTDELVRFTASQQLPNGPDHGSLPVPDLSASVLPTVFAAMSYSYLEHGQSQTADGALLEAAAWMLTKEAPSGEVVPEDINSPPVAQGSIMTSANAAFAFAQAFDLSHDARFKAAADKAVAFVAAAAPVTTQDHVFKLLALSRLGTDPQKALLATLVKEILAAQDASGGWSEAPDLEGPNAFATGQVLYALKQAGVSVESPEFNHGVDYLLRTQQLVGSWNPTATHSPSLTAFAPTMWAVIGLAGSLNAHRAEGEPPPSLERQFKAAVESTGRFVLHINFDFDKATLRPDALPTIDQVASLLHDHPDWRFEIDGYTDNVGTIPHNQRLSEQRAQSVLTALTERQVDATRLSSAGFGSGSPVDTNDTEDGRFQNRRVELVRQ
jgi:outer membrane protein OmpA-like peptidoglycan-associated protein